MNLYEAIEKGNTKEFKKTFLKEKAKKPAQQFLECLDNVNRYRATTLEYSLRHASLSNDYTITLILLENGESPNEAWSPQRKPIIPSLSSGNKSKARLLILYGADIRSINFEELNLKNDMQDFVNSIYRIAKRHKKLLKDAMENKDAQAYDLACTAFKKLADSWYSISLSESDHVLQKHYRKKAFSFYQEAISCYQLSTPEQKFQHQEAFKEIIDKYDLFQQNLASKKPNAETSTNLFQKFHRKIQGLFTHKKEFSKKNEEETLISKIKSDERTICRFS